jgi:predicted acylesterase/phospholipase RssA
METCETTKTSNNIRTVPKIHFILPGGGVRGAFQAGFLYRLYGKYREYFDVAKIDGTSVGSMNGIAIACENHEVIKKIWFSIKGLNDLFYNWSNSNYFGLGQYISYYYGFYNNGLFDNSKITSLLNEHIKENLDNLTEEQKNKYSCAVVNINKASTEYIHGNNPQLFRYITASASPWIVTNPLKINEDLYTDGGLLETYPIKNINAVGADMTLILGYDQEHFIFESNGNNNMLEYLANLIDIARFNSINTEIVRSFLKNKKEDIVCLPNPMKVSFVDFNTENIQYGFTQGEEFADSFFKTYLENYKKI